MDRTYDLRPKNLIPRAAHLADIVRNATTFIETILENAEEVYMIINYALKCNLYLYFIIVFI